MRQSHELGMPPDNEDLDIESHRRMKPNRQIEDFRLKPRLLWIVKARALEYEEMIQVCQVNSPLCPHCRTGIASYEVGTGKLPPIEMTGRCCACGEWLTFTRKESRTFVRIYGDPKIYTLKEIK